jgi:nucleotide-binding universal stress UspA family protein
MGSDVVVGYDQTPAGERALAEAAAEAVRRGATLTVVHALHHPPAGHAAVREAAVREAAARDVAEQGADRARSRHPGLTVRARTQAGQAAIVLAGQSSHADLLVVGHHSHGSLRPRAVALRTVAHAACPAMVVRGSEHRVRGTVVAAVDVGEAGDAGESAGDLLGFAYSEAAARGARLKAVSTRATLWPRRYIGEDSRRWRTSRQATARAEEALERMLEPWPQAYPDVVTDRELIEGSPTVFLTGATTYADLIVVGTRRRTAGRRGSRVGPVAHTLLLHSDCPVVVVPHGSLAGRVVFS